VRVGRIRLPPSPDLYPKESIMAKFVGLERVERIEWDFEGVPHVGAQDDDRVPATVQGEHVKGVLPEPDPDTAARFVEAHEDLIAEALKARQATIDRFISAAGEEDVDPAEVSAEVLGTADAYRAQCDKALEALRIVGVPSELLDQLPPRYLSAFLAYVAGELQGEDVAA
jgi:hypothetical protein